MTPQLRSAVIGSLIFAALALLTGCGQMFGITLVEDVQSEYTIVISPESSPSQRYAAAELATYVGQISGLKLAVAEAATDGPMVLVGPSAALESVAPGIDYEALGAEGVVMRTVGRHLVLTGGRPRGTLYAVYEFLDGQLGCRWYTSGGATPPVVHIPRRATIKVPALNETRMPALDYRSAWIHEAFEGDWAARNRLNGHNTAVTEKHGGKIRFYRTQAWHTFRRFVDNSEIGEHPEWFAYTGGKRSTSQLCTSHPEVIKRVTETIQSWISGDPEAKFFTIVANDGGGFCGCELCGPLTEYEGSRVAPVLHLCNQVGDAIRDEYPDVMIDTLAYSPTCPPPRFVGPRDNVMVRFATAQACRAHPIEENCGDAWHMATFIRAWAARCPQMYVWDYQTIHSNHLMPFPNFHTLQPNIQYFVRNKVKGIFNQAAVGGGGEFAELRAYMLARVMWDPDCDFEGEMARFMDAYYGPAGKVIGKYIAMMRGHVAWGPKAFDPLPTNVVCPASGRLMSMRDGEFQPLLACENHPKCKSVFDVRGDSGMVELPPRPPLATDVPCPDCGRGLELRRSNNYGPWLLCPDYPNCIGRIGWSKLDQSKQAALEAALAVHEKATPQLKVRTLDGREYEAGGKPLNVTVRRQDANPWMKVDTFGGINAKYVTKDIIDRAGKLFDEAEAAVADDPVLLLRVRKERLGIEVVRIMKADQFLPDTQAYEQAVKSFAQIVERWGIKHFSEGGDIEPVINGWRKRVRKLKEEAGG